MSHYSTKTYGHNIGLSAVFRQPHADHSHCRFLHGYSLGFKFKFACNELDNKNWVVDFGGLKPLKKWLEDSFDVIITQRLLEGIFHFSLIVVVTTWFTV